MYDFDSLQDTKAGIISIKNPSTPSMLLRLWLEMLSDTDTQTFSGSFAEGVQSELDSFILAEQKMNFKNKILEFVERQFYFKVSVSKLMNFNSTHGQKNR